MDKRYFSDKVVEWYQINRRELPWRQTKDPYRIWLSEIILQQTRVIQGLPYYLKFVEKFPTVAALAAASEQEVLRLWQGLGYYTRARNLHKCAKEVMRLYNGSFPENYSELLKLPGIGEYTAAAIASFSYKEPVAVVDGNVFRVLSRVFGIALEINRPEGKKHFTQVANELISKQNPDFHNQAMMEFGATHCTPKNPKCEECVFKVSCFAFQKNVVNDLPVKVKSKASQKRFFHYVVIRKGKSLAMTLRDQKGIWHGLYDFPLIEKKRAVKIEKILIEDLKWTAKKSKPEVSSSYKHILSHQIITAKFIILPFDEISAELKKKLKFYSPKQIAELPKPVLINRFLHDHHLL